MDDQIIGQNLIMSNPRKRITSALLFSLLALGAQAQTSFKDLDSKVPLEEGVSAYNQGKYKEAIKLLQRIPQGDTNYYVAQYELGLALIADSQFDEAIRVSKLVADNFPNERRQALLNMGTASSYKGELNTALRYYDSVLHLYPTDHRPHFEKGLVYVKMEDFEKAAASFEQALMKAPTHWRSHYMLGVVYIAQGRMAEGLIAAQTSLIFISNSEEAHKVLTILDHIALQRDYITEAYRKKTSEYRHKVFDNISEVIHSEVALKEDYKMSSRIDYALVRQLSVVFDLLTFDANDKNFVMQYYVPLLTQIKDKGKFDDYILYLLSEYGIEDVDKHLGSKKGKGKAAEMRGIIVPYFDMIYATNELEYKKRSFNNAKAFAFPAEGIIVLGKPADSSFATPAAGYVKLYKDHLLTAEGRFNSEAKKDGKWKYYFPDGSVSLEEEYKNGELVGTLTRYAKSGFIDYTITYDEQGEFLKRTDYKYNGLPYSKQEKLGNGNLKVVMQHLSGSEYYTRVYQGPDWEKLIDGPMKFYHTNGKLYKEYSLKGGAIDGNYKEFYEDGTLSYDINYKDGKYHGAYKSYYANGKPSTICTYVNGVPNGLMEEYYSYSDKYYTQEFKEGTLHGYVRYFDSNKKEFGTLKYEAGKLVSALFKDKSGKVVYQKEDAKGIAVLELFNEYGVRIKYAPLNQNGNVHGLVKNYFDSGVLRSELNYDDGKMSGDAKYYFENGNLSHTRQYKDGDENGLYQGFEESAELNYKGWMMDDTEVGKWQSFYHNGKVSLDYFMLDGKKNGDEKHHDFYGKHHLTYIYDQGMLVGLKQFDAGKIINEQYLPKGEGKLKQIYPNGNIEETVAVKYGYYHGTYESFAPDKQILTTGKYEYGKAHGRFESFYFGGQKRYVGEFKKGKRHGAFVYYDPLGNVTDEVNYDDGDLEGSYKTYVNGMLRYDYQYTDGKRHGRNLIIGDNNQIAAVLYFDFGNLVGYSYLDANGQELPMIPVHAGTAIVKTFYASGAKAIEFAWKNNLLEGTQRLYYSNGKLAEERNFSKGMFEGSYKRWMPNGNLYYEVTYRKDRKHGDEKFYDANSKALVHIPYVDDFVHGEATYLTTKKSAKKLKFDMGQIRF